MDWIIEKMDWIIKIEFFATLNLMSELLSKYLN